MKSSVIWFVGEKIVTCPVRAMRFFIVVPQVWIGLRVKSYICMVPRTFNSGVTSKCPQDIHAHNTQPYKL